MFHRNDQVGYADDHPAAPIIARPGVRAAVSAFCSSRRGAWAIQAAIAVPLLIAMYAPAATVVSAWYDRLLVSRAAGQTTQMASQYTDLYDSDFAETFFPIAQGIAGRKSATGASLACGVVISGIDMDRGTPVVRWQKSFGSCAESRVGQVSTPPMLAVGYERTDDAPLLVVEISGAAPRDSGARLYAIAQAAPRQGSLPKVMPGSRF